MSPRSSELLFDSSKIEEAIEKAVQAVSADISYPEIPEELFEIFVYLPELFQDGDEERYIEALSLAMQTSYENGLYQFAYMQYHMLFMTAIYFVLLKLYVLHHDEMEQALYYLLKIDIMSSLEKKTPRTDSCILEVLRLLEKVMFLSSYILLEWIPI